MTAIVLNPKLDAPAMPLETMFTLRNAVMVKSEVGRVPNTRTVIVIRSITAQSQIHRPVSNALEDTTRLVSAVMSAIEDGSDPARLLAPMLREDNLTREPMALVMLLAKAFPPMFKLVNAVSVYSVDGIEPKHKESRLTA